MEIMEETQVEYRKYLEKYGKSLLNSEMIGKIWKKSTLNSEKI
jgi:hypothetical protein